MKELISLISLAITESHGMGQVGRDRRGSAGKNFFLGCKSFSLWLAHLLFSANTFFV